MQTENKAPKLDAKDQIKNVKDKKDIIAERKSCSADGVGLSHYILVDREAKQQ